MSNRTDQTGTQRNSTNAAPDTHPRQLYIGAAVALVAVGCALAWAADKSDVKYSPTVAVSTFAILYILAQGIERLVEVTIAIVDYLTGPEKFAETRKDNALAVLKTGEGRDPTGDAQKAVAAARGDLTVLTQGLSFALSIVAVSYVHYGVLQTIGATDLNVGVDRVFTALAIMGGSKGLHDLISKVQKSKEKDEEK